MYMLLWRCRFVCITGNEPEDIQKSDIYEGRNLLCIIFTCLLVLHILAVLKWSDKYSSFLPLFLVQFNYIFPPYFVCKHIAFLL